MKIALVVPHIFMQQSILEKVIFSPGWLAIELARQLTVLGHRVTLATPGPVVKLLPSPVTNLTTDLSQFEAELNRRGDSYLSLLKKHPLTFISLARQAQLQLIGQVISAANQGQYDLVHFWANEEEQALVMAQFCHQPTVFTHHEPFNFLVNYRAIFPQYPHLNWVSLSLAQRPTFVTDQPVNWVGNVYHGLDVSKYQFESQPADYLLYLGRIISPKGVHYAIEVARQLNLKLKIAGLHYGNQSKDRYWQEFILPQLDGEQIEYLGLVKDQAVKQQLLGKAAALLMPSTWSEPFGLVMVEALACGTPIVGFKNGAIPEVVENGVTGWLVDYQAPDLASAQSPQIGEPSSVVGQQSKTSFESYAALKKNPAFKANVHQLAQAVTKVARLDRRQCRASFERRFTSQQMASNYVKIYEKVRKKVNYSRC